MTEPSLGIALGSTFCRIGDVEYNLAQIAILAGQARRASAHFLLTPELSATGYGPYPEVAALAEVPGEGPIYDGLAAIAKKTGVVVAAGFVEKHAHGPGISHYVVYPDGGFVVQRKFRVTPFESPLVSALHDHVANDWDIEKLDFGTLNFSTFEIQGLKCAVAICADYRIENLHDHLDTLGVRVLFVPTGAGGNVNDRVSASDLQTTEGRAKYMRALENAYFPPAKHVFDCVMHRRAMAAVNQTGWDGRKCAHIGDGSAISPRGEMPILICGVPNLDFQRPAFGAGNIPLSHFDPVNVPA